VAGGEIDEDISLEDYTISVSIEMVRLVLLKRFRDACLEGGRAGRVKLLCSQRKQSRRRGNAK
jgi:hypothetical protein